MQRFCRELCRGFERELAEGLRESGRGFELCGVSDIVTGQMRCAPGTMPRQAGHRPALARSVREEKEELTTKKVSLRLSFCKKIYGLHSKSGQERTARKARRKHAPPL